MLQLLLLSPLTPAPSPAPPRAHLSLSPCHGGCPRSLVLVSHIENPSLLREKRTGEDGSVYGRSVQGLTSGRTFSGHLGYKTHTRNRSRESPLLGRLWKRGAPLPAPVTASAAGGRRWPLAVPRPGGRRPSCRVRFSSRLKVSILAFPR